MIFGTFGLPIIVLLPFFGAIIAALVAKQNRIASAWSAGIITILSFGILYTYAHLPFEGVTTIQSWQWISSIGLEFAFRLDGLGLLFAGLILVIGLLVIIYARYYISSNDCMGRFYSYLLLFMGSMLGIVLSENILQLVVFWELTSLSSFLLISYWQHKAEGRDGAKMALAITGAGGLAMLAGALMLGNIVGSYNLTDILASGDLIRSHSLYTPIIILILLGVFTKSAQFPFHFWLPHAMAAPTPVSAYLHSATMVKAGIFLLARLFPALSGTTEWIVLVSTAGMATLLIGAFTAMFKHDLKGLLAYSTISHLGLITLLFGFSTPLAAVAAIFHIINHATFKASLFMVAGIIDHETGTRDMRRLSGLWAFMPHTATLAMVAASAMAGVPLLNGFLSKEMFFERALEDATLHTLIIPILATVAGMFSVAYSIRFIHDVFFNGETKELPKTPHEPPRFMKIPVDLLVIACFAVGTLPMFTVAPILATAVMGSLQAPLPDYSLAIWHGFNIPLMMSIVAFIGGSLIYYKREKVFAWYEKNLSHIDARVPYNKLIDSVFNFAQSVTSRFDSGSLQNMVIWFLGASIFVGIAGFNYSSAPLFGNREFLSVDWITIVAALILVIATFTTAFLHHKRLIALISLSVVGLIVSLTFIKFSAPDLALTQLSVEVVTIVLILLALYYLPQSTPKESSKSRINRDIVISVLGGVGVFILTMAVLSREYSTIATYFLENSLTGGGGTNVVNVILVDFRGFDTLGEITVLAIAGLGIFAMLQGLKLYAPTADINGNPWSKDMHPPMMQTLTRLLLPLMLMVAVYIFLRGHNLPGGGFIAGLIAAVALIVQYLANGIDWTKKRLRFEKDTIIAYGLLIGTATGLVSMLIGYPFLTSAFTHLHWPIVGEFEIASAIAFDLGVFLVVVGATVMILVQLGKLSVQSHSQVDENGNLKGDN
ncbi:monovalent cation/H+ antiporter subunit A [Arcobacter sp. FWKO B]|uniref:monovalent cation/H+ antiporter subunit A n=1 Tax=Arcobacter sp. FWKO B TaxID=2593672 RepID=UPI0018A612B5|nr:monovalent cation/H+ antiporter subunit A [Arcobacter sp. FWKO B]QOG12416.1 monovalent cation/H+ antiporter subunit A [Arcobacter sp. FWKO B]